MTLRFRQFRKQLDYGHDNAKGVAYHATHKENLSHILKHGITHIGDGIGLSPDPDTAHSKAGTDPNNVVVVKVKLGRGGKADQRNPKAIERNQVLGYMYKGL
jgi:hypothetical protein